MTPRKKSEEIQKAKSQKIQEIVHRILYCDTDWNEAEIYGQRFELIVKRSNLKKINNSDTELQEDISIEYKKRIIRKLNGKEPLDKSLVFYKIIYQLKGKSMCSEELVIELDEHLKDYIYINLDYLEKSGLVEKIDDKYTLSLKIKKLT